MELLILIYIINIFLCQDIDIIEIKSFQVFTIKKNQKDILFKYNYLSNEKTDIIIYISPFTKESILGQLFISTNLDSIKTKKNSKEIKSVFLNFDNKKSIVFNTYEDINIGNNTYYISLSGKISCNFEIFLSNEIRIISIENSYYFPSISNMTSSYLTLQLNYLSDNIFLNILKNNKSYDNIEIYKDNNIISEISEYFKIEKYHKYSIKLFYEYDVDVVFNFLKTVIQSINAYNKNLLFLDDSEFYFIIDLSHYHLNSTIGICIDYDSKTEIELFYLDNIEKDKIPDIDILEYYNYTEYNSQNSFLLTHYNENLTNVLIKIKISNFTNIPLKIDIYSKIYYIDVIPFNFHIKDEKYFFFIKSELKEKYYGLENYIFLRFNASNNMIIYTSNKNMIYRDRIDYEKINDIISICFNNYIEGEFNINLLSSTLNKKILNDKYDFLNIEKYSVLTEDKNEFTEIIKKDIETIIYLNLIIGNASFYLINNIDYSFDYLKEIPVNNKKIINGIQIVNEKEAVLKFKVNSFSIFEYFIQDNNNNNNNYYLLYKPMIKYFKEDIIYEIIFILINGKILAKLLTIENSVTLYKDKTELILNSNNLNLILQESGNYFVKGHNSLVAFYTSLTNNTNYSISTKDNEDFYYVQEIFIVPNATNYNSICLFITYFDDKEDNCILNYLVDYNIIPFSRKNFENFERIAIKSNKRMSLIIKNFYRENKSKSTDNNEKLFIYILFSTILSKVNIEIKYTDYNFLNINELFIIKPGFNKIFLGSEYKYYINLKLCENNKINYNFVKNGENESSSIYNEVSSNEILFLDNENIDEHYSIYINNEKEILLSFTNNEIENNISNLNYNFSVNMKYIDSVNREIFFEFNPISYYPEVEYFIFIFDSKYLNDLANHCFIFHLIEDNLYLYKKTIISNGEELSFNLNIKINNITQGKEDYILLIMAKEILYLYPNYKFYEYIKFNFDGKRSETDSDKIINEEENNIITVVIIIIYIIMIIIIIILIIIFVYYIYFKKKNSDTDLEKLNELTSQEENNYPIID